MLLDRRALTRLLGAAAATAVGLPARADDEMKRVAITAIVEHPALDATRDGIKAELLTLGWQEGKTVVFSYESAQGNPATAAQIARKLVGEAPDVIVPISTPSAQAVAAATTDIPIVFTAVTDPVGAGLVTDLAHPGGNITGMSDLSPIAKQMALIKEITPNVTKLGVIYNPGEANSVTLVELIRQSAPELGMEVVAAVAPKSADVLAATQSLVGEVEAIYVPTDNTVVSAFEAVTRIAVEQHIPLYAGDTDSVPRGAIAALGFNYRDVGRQTGRIVAKVLRGANPGDIPVEGVELTELHLNTGAAARMGVEIPPNVLARAMNVVP